MNDQKCLVQIQINKMHQVSTESTSVVDVINENNRLSPSVEIEGTTRINAFTKLLYLDGLRGILCLIVVCSHCLLMGQTNHDQKFSIFFQPWMQHSPLRLLVAGEFAVAGFFVLSGCVLVRRYFEHPHDFTIIFSGLIRRFPRLFIPSTVALLFYYGILHFRPFHGYNECHEIGEGSVDPESVHFGYVLLNTFGQYFWMQALYTIQWTMQVEFICSIIIYMLAFAFTRPLVYHFRMLLYVFFILIVPIIWLVTGEKVPRPVQYVTPFIFGLLLSDLDAAGILTYFHTMKRHWLIFINITLVFLTIYVGSYPVFNTKIVNGRGTLWAPLGWMYGWFWISLGGFCLLLLLMLSKEVQYFLSTRIIHFLGKISFGIYLTHYIILGIVDTSFVKWVAPSLGRDLAVVMGLIIISFPLTLLISYTFYLIVDVPAVQIADWLYFVSCHRCLKLTKRPRSIKRPIWIVLVAFIIMFIIIGVIPPLSVDQRCSGPSSENRTLTP